METATIKIGMNKGRRRIWLEGRRLLDAGFKGGMTYKCVVEVGAIKMTIPGDDRKVTGRPDGRPIIDIIGRDVETAFPTGERVTVRFEKGRITVVPYLEEMKKVAARR